MVVGLAERVFNKKGFFGGGTASKLVEREQSIGRADVLLHLPTFTKGERFPRYNGIPCEVKYTHPTGTTRLFEALIQGNDGRGKLFVSRQDGTDAYLDLWQRDGYRYNFAYNTTVDSSGTGYATLLKYTGQYIWWSVKNSGIINRVDLDNATVVDTLSTGLMNLRSPYYFPSLTGVLCFDEDNEVYLLSTVDGSVISQTSGLNNVRQMYPHTDGGEFFGAFVVRSTGSVSYVRPDFTVEDPTDWDTANTGLTGNYFRTHYVHNWPNDHKFVVIESGTDRIHAFGVDDNVPTVFSYFGSQQYNQNVYGIENLFFFTDGNRLIMPGHDGYMEASNPTLATNAREESSLPWPSSITAGTVEEGIFIDTGDPVDAPENYIREAIFAAGNQWVIVR